MKTKKVISSGAIADGLTRIVDKWNKAESQPQDYGTGILLSLTEMRLLETIGEYRGSSVTELAKIHAVTKGATSQILKKLEAKDLVLKKVDPANSSRLLVDLTQEGEKAYRAHKEWHNKIDSDFKSYIDGLSSTNIEFLQEFLGNVEQFLNKRIKEGKK